MATNHTEYSYNERRHPSDVCGVQRIYRFANGYGASVVRTGFSYGGRKGLWELAVVKHDSPDDFDFEIVKNSRIAEDGVVGYLTEEALEWTLSRIEKL